MTKYFIQATRIKWTKQPRSFKHIVITIGKWNQWKALFRGYMKSIRVRICFRQNVSKLRVKGTFRLTLSIVYAILRTLANNSTRLLRLPRGFSDCLDFPPGVKLTREVEESDVLLFCAEKSKQSIMTHIKLLILSRNLTFWNETLQKNRYTLVDLRKDIKQH